jgi:hypothetical protein
MFFRNTERLFKFYFTILRGCISNCRASVFPYCLGTFSQWGSFQDGWESFAANAGGRIFAGIKLNKKKYDASAIIHKKCVFLQTYRKDVLCGKVQ